MCLVLWIFEMDDSLLLSLFHSMIDKNFIMVQLQIQVCKCVLINTQKLHLYDKISHYKINIRGNSEIIETISFNTFGENKQFEFR